MHSVVYFSGKQYYTNSPFRTKMVALPCLLKLALLIKLKRHVSSNQSKSYHCTLVRDNNNNNNNNNIQICKAPYAKLQRR